MIVVIICAILTADQLTKYIVTRALSLNQSIPVIPGIFHITLVHNRGAAFGIFQNYVPLFVVISILAVFVIVRILKKSSSLDILTRVGFACILAGALGNAIDRITVGHVIDFIDFRVWWVFNVADSAITVGTVILIASNIVPHFKKKGNKPDAS